MQGVQTLILVAAIMGGVFILISALAYMYSLRGIKSRTVGDGQHGTARWATRGEVKEVYHAAIAAFSFCLRAVNSENGGDVLPFPRLLY